MPDSWSQIDDDGVMMDWTSADSIKLCDLRHSLDAIRRAINERQTVTGASATTPIVRLSGIIETINILHSAISNLITGFVNYTDNDGNWDNTPWVYGGTIIPNFDEETVLSLIGDESRVVVSRLDDISSWLMQSRKILNVLKWSKETPNGRLDSSVQSKFSSADYTDSSDYATLVGLAESRYESAVWQDGYLLGTGGGQYFEFLPNPGGYVYFLTTKFKMHKIKTVYFDGSVDLYTAFTNLNYWGGPDVYNSPDSYIQNVLYKVDTTTFSSGATDIISGYLPTSTRQASLLPSEITGPYQNAKSCFIQAASPIFVLKFDGANGFKFKDW